MCMWVSEPLPPRRHQHHHHQHHQHLHPQQHQHRRHLHHVDVDDEEVHVQGRVGRIPIFGGQPADQERARTRREPSLRTLPLVAGERPFPTPSVTSRTGLAFVAMSVRRVDRVKLLCSLAICIGRFDEMSVASCAGRGGLCLCDVTHPGSSFRFECVPTSSDVEFLLPSWEELPSFYSLMFTENNGTSPTAGRGLLPCW